jgi:hypothetical protein
MKTATREEAHMRSETQSFLALKNCGVLHTRTAMGATRLNASITVAIETGQTGEHSFLHHLPFVQTLVI